jgi:hypothetical protein
MLHLEFPQLFLFPSELVFLEPSGLGGDLLGGHNIVTGSGRTRRVEESKFVRMRVLDTKNIADSLPDVTADSTR